MDEAKTVGQRARLGLSWVGVLFFAAVALLATIHLLADGWAIASRLNSLSGLLGVLVSVAVIAAGLAWTVGIAWLAGSGKQRATIAVIAAFITLVAVRLIIAYSYDGVLSGEPGVYSSHAARLAAGECCPWDEPIDRPPGYSFLLAGAFSIFGRSAVVPEALNILFAVATGLLVFEMARGLYGIQAGAVAMLLYGLWPAGALMVTVRLPHTAYDLAFLAAAWAVIATPAGWRGSALAGAILGISQYIRPTTLLLLPVFIVARVWPGARVRTLFTGAILPLATMFLVVLIPIMAWNLSTRGALDVSTSAYSGHSMYHGTNVTSGGTWSSQAADELKELGGPDRWERNRVGTRLALERLREDPLGMIALALRKQDTFWGAEAYGIRYGIRRDLASRPYLPKSVLPSLASGTFYAAVLAAAALGLYLRRRESDALAALLILTALSLTLIHGLVEVRDRYHSYVIPVLMPIAAVAVVALVNTVRLRRQPRASDRVDR